jgi:hypothetical protein
MYQGLNAGKVSDQIPVKKTPSMRVNNVDIHFSQQGCSSIKETVIEPGSFSFQPHRHTDFVEPHLIGLVVAVQTQDTKIESFPVGCLAQLENQRFESANFQKLRNVADCYLPHLPNRFGFSES